MYVWVGIPLLTYQGYALIVGSWKALGIMISWKSRYLWARKAFVVYIQVQGYNSFGDNMTNLAYMYQLTNYNRLVRTGEDYYIVFYSVIINCRFWFEH